MNKLELLAKQCKADVAIFINSHKRNHETITEYLEYDERKEDISNSKIFENIVEKDFIVELIFYPFTPVGSYTVIHYGIDLAIDEALEIMKEITI